MQWINTMLEPAASAAAALNGKKAPIHTKRPKRTTQKTSKNSTAKGVDHLYSTPPDDATHKTNPTLSSSNPLLFCRQAAATVVDTDQMTELWTAATPQKLSQTVTKSCLPSNNNNKTKTATNTPTTAASSPEYHVVDDYCDNDTYQATKEEIYLQKQQQQRQQPFDPGAHCLWCKPEDISRPQDEYHLPPEELKRNLQQEAGFQSRRLQSPFLSVPSDEGDTDTTTLKHTNVAPKKEPPPGLTQEPTRSWLAPWTDELVGEEKKEDEPNNNHPADMSLPHDPIQFLTRTISAVSKQSLNMSTANCQGSQPNAHSVDQNAETANNNKNNDTSLHIVPADEPIAGLPTEVIIYRPRAPWQNADGSNPVMQITWYVDCHRERGLVDKWTGSLHRDNDEIGYITVYAISARIMDQALIGDRVVQEFVDEFLLPVLVLDNRQHRQRTSQNVTQDLSLAQELAAGPLYLVSDITIQPRHRGTGLGLYLLDAACRQVANNHSLGDKKTKHGGAGVATLAVNESCINGVGPVIVSMREAIDNTLAVYFGLLGFTQGLRDNYVIRRRPQPDQKCPYPIVEDVCPHIPTQAPRGAEPPADKRASF